MRKLFRSLPVVALLGIAPLLVACGREDRPNYEQQVRQNLEANNLDDVRVDWNQDEQTLRLSGEVQSAADRQRAEELAGQVVGTAGRVVNEVRVEGVDHGEIDNRIEDQLNRMFEDRTEWDFDGRGVRFDVNAGVVTIEGTVESQQIRERIGQRARQVEGVRDVVNNLEVDADRRTRDELP